MSASTSLSAPERYLRGGALAAVLALAAALLAMGWVLYRPGGAPAAAAERLESLNSTADRPVRKE